MSKNKKNKKKKGKIFLILLLLSAAAACVLIFGFQVRDVQVVGNNYVSSESIEAWVMEDVYMDNSLLAVLKDRDKTDTPAMTESVQVSWSLPWKLRVTVEEKQPAGYVQQNNDRLYFDPEGYVLIRTKESLDGVLRVNGLENQNASEGEKLETEDPEIFGNISEAADAVKEVNLYPAEIDVEDNKVVLVFGTIRVVLGDRDMKEKIFQLPEILRMLGNETGVLHLEKYSSDLKSIWFEDSKNEKISVKSID